MPWIEVGKSVDLVLLGPDLYERLAWCMARKMEILPVLYQSLPTVVHR
ncbi:hypothetical protein [Acinetobacter baumannii]|nr:hypothetical protein [Acinetobacter baumannii]